MSPENGGGTHIYWGELLKADLKSEFKTGINSVQQQVSDLSQKLDTVSKEMSITAAKMKTKPSKNWVRGAIAAALATAGTATMALVEKGKGDAREAAAEMVARAEEARRVESMQLRTEVQNMGNRTEGRIDRLGDTIIRAVSRGRRPPSPDDSRGPTP